MLIPFEIINQFLQLNNIKVKGSLHIGAHECEELGFYNQLGVSQNNIVWIDAMYNKVLEAKNRGIPNVYQSVISDQDDQEVKFNVSNNGQSSSILEFQTHAYQHPDVVYISSSIEKTTTIDTFFSRNNLNASKYNFWNFDIQGAELLALKGASNSIQYADAIYLEVNEDYLYKDCALIDEIDQYLKLKGFNRVHTVMTQWKWGDALYIKQALQSSIH
jgi:FkbM family methyltransferase